MPQDSDHLSRSVFDEAQGADRGAFAPPRQPAAGEVTRAFSAFAETPEKTAASAPVPAVPQTPAQPSSGEFTQIFTQIAKPTSPAPEMMPSESPAPAAPHGEFTQFFSSLPGPAAPARATPPLAPPSPAPPPPARLPEAALPVVPPPPPTQQEPGTFTQLFQQIGGPPQQQAGAPPQTMPQPDFRPAPDFKPAPEVRRAREDAGMFAEPAHPGSLSEIFRSPPSTNAAAAPFKSPAADPGRAFAASAPPRSSAPGSGGFTQLFQSLGEEPPRSSQPSAVPLPSTPSASAPQPQGAGEFTRLMQSLGESSAAPEPVSRTNPMGPVNPMNPMSPMNPVATPFFAESGMQSGTSEFTRVMQGSAFRDGGAVTPARAVAPTFSASTPPGLAIAPAAQEKKSESKDEGSKTKRWVLLLALVNGLLLLALAVLAFFLMHRHH